MTAGKYVDLTYLMNQTKNNVPLAKKMVALYIKQTPELIQTMKKAAMENDWATVNGAVHKMIPSFWMMGIDPGLEKIAKIIQEHSLKEEKLVEIPELLDKLELGCSLACNELEELIKELG